MASSERATHAGPGTANAAPVGEPTHSERARTLLYVARTGSLSTISVKQAGFPFGSVMPYALDTEGHPIFLISTMAMHTKNLQADPRCGLLVTHPDAGADPLASSRVTLIGQAKQIEHSDVPNVRELYLARHGNSRSWVDYADFSFYRMDVLDVYYIGGFGVMGWVAASEFEAARPDPLVDSAAGIIQHMNKDHADALILMARKFAGIETSEATMTSVDRLGFQLRYKIDDGARTARIAFLRPVTNSMETRSVLVEMVSQAREK